MTLPEFLDNSPSPAWAVESAVSLLEKKGFERGSAKKLFLTPHSGMLIAARLPEKISAANAKFRIIGAHTDSPHLRLKPNAVTTREGHSLIASEIYGGALLYTWFDRELGIAGEIFYQDGKSIAHKLVKIDKPVAIVPSLAIHLQRGVNEDGFIPEKAQGLSALATLQGDTDLIKVLTEAAGVAPDALLSYDLSFYDLNKANRGGLKGELLHSARLDNLVSCYAALEALKVEPAENTIAVAILFDHEEIGSESESGAESQLTENILADIAASCGLNQKDFRAALGRSVFLSADMAHGVHPNYADKHDKENRPHLGGGVTLKINQNRRYATSGLGQAEFHNICKSHAIPSQIYTHRNDLPCGSTIGPTMSARLGIPTIDVGIAMLGMHSIRETCAWDDLGHYEKFMEKFLNS